MLFSSPVLPLCVLKSKTNLEKVIISSFTKMCYLILNGALEVEWDKRKLRPNGQEHTHMSVWGSGSENLSVACHDCLEGSGTAQSLEGSAGGKGHGRERGAV